LDELVAKQIYATYTVKTIASSIKKVVDFRNAFYGTLEWRMHQSRQMTTLMWKDKKHVLLLSTHVIPIDYPCMPVPMVLKKNSAKSEDIMILPMHLEYTTHMCGVDMTDQLRILYGTHD
jgi:hypothetical protein